MKEIFKDTGFRQSVILTTIFIGTGIAFLFLGLTGYSLILFGLLPTLLGFTIGMIPVRKSAYAVLWGAIITTIILLVVIFILGHSGAICIVMASPLLIAAILFGYAIARIVKQYKLTKETNRLSILILPIIPFLIAAPSEQLLKKEKEVIIEVKTEKVFNYTPDEVYDAIKSVDTLDAEKPFLLKLDLPIPTKCILEKEEVGALRTCYFKGGRLSNADFGGGTITERVTQLEKGKVLKMDVIDYNLIGRNWLGFKEAIYYFEPIGENSCKLTRVTTYTSVLTPRFYWEPMEKLGVQQEHEYVFNNLEKDLKNKYGR